MKTIRALAPTLLAASLFSVSAAATAGFTVTYEAPGVTNTTASFKPRPDASGQDIVGVETFDNLTLGVHASYESDFGNGGLDIKGTYSNLNVVAANQYGGASGNDQYAVAGLGVTSSYSILFDTSLTYFGYWLSALDAGNQVSFYDGNDLVLAFTPTNVLALVGNDPAYFGNPTTPNQGQNPAEPYVFLNFFAEDGTSFNRIVFAQPNNAGYESDNHTVGIWEEQSGTVVPPSQVPEPGMLLLMSAALMAAAGATRRRS
ncbi:Npun_F0296 family exosortase-dependent surface protein [Thauera sp. Sel9]|uniref:Npun_F0296 family exosortase-dependent surface protein n=1 Tax=Thauera sp. Sel9 TaxID=2974299 RepID=UPI0021E14BC2|nr:PEP-CTERM sorting domain-containing protein [Thauera sp. Sel9]MCV2216952.1 PEP-CTERM sorting domain-containing protein [Thauera sp. Sel9]